MNRQKHKLSRRILAMLLTAAMLVTMFPAAMFATPTAEVGSEGVPKLDVSKSKTATNLQQNADGDWQSNVTLSLPSEEYSQTMDVVFVIDDSSAGSSIFAGPAMELLGTLRNTKNLDVNVGVVTFDALARDWVSVTSDGKYSDLVSVKSEEGYNALSEAINTELSDGAEAIGQQRKIGGSNTEWAIDEATKMLNAGNGEEKYMIIFSDMYGYVYRGTLTVDGQEYENVPLSKRISGLSLASLADPEPKYDNWGDVNTNRTENNSEYDSYFRYWTGSSDNRNIKPWTDYWTIYRGLEQAPDVDAAFEEAEDAAFPWSTAGHYTPFEQSSVLTYDNILEAVYSNINVTVVNNNFDPGDPGGPRIKDIKNGMLDDLAESRVVQLIREDAEHGTNFSSDQMEKIFANLSDELIQVVGVGSEVVDIIGDDFDFVNSADNPPTLTVDGEPLVATQLTEDSAKDATLAWSFGDKTTSKRFELYYYQDGTTYDGDAVGECFIWKTNEDITKDATVQLTYTVQLTEPSTEPDTYGEYDKNGDGYLNDAEGNETQAPATLGKGLFTNDRATIYPVDSNGDQGTQKDFPRPTVSYTVAPKGEVLITPADITVYTGGTSYSGVINDLEDGTADQSSEGLPEPGYYLTLPDWINGKLNIFSDNEGASTGTNDLSNNITFTYEGKDSSSGESVTRSWPIDLYYNGEDGTSFEKDIVIGGVERDRYIYQIEPSGNNTVRVQFQPLKADGTVDETADPILSDEFDLNLDTLYQQYDMTIYAGYLAQQEVKAEIRKDGELIATLPVKVDHGTLTVRGTTNGEAIVEVGDAENAAAAVAANTQTIDNETESTITAVADNNVDYYINDSMVSVAPEAVHLLADELVGGDNAEKAQAILKDYMVEKDIADEGANFSYQYLDLVDNTNGNAWVTPTDEVDIYWKVPKNTNSDDYDFKIVHFNGLNRQYDQDTEDLIGNDGYDVEEYTVENRELEIVEIDNEEYLKFSTDTFSPFVLVWDEADDNPPYIPPSTGDDDDKPDTPSLNKDDHFLYIEGYPEDYRTGEYSDNEDLWPVKPQGNITRAEVATIFYRLLKDEVREEIETDVNSFPDVNADDWFNITVSSLANMGAISGYEDGTFRPNEPISRAELASMAVRFYDAFEVEYEEGTFLDVDGDEWYADAIAAAEELGIIGGYPDGTVRPNNNITRAETCAIVNRVLERRPHDEHLGDVEDMRTWPDNQPGAWYYADMQEATNGHYYEWIDIDGSKFEEWTEVDKDYDWTKR